MPTITAEIIFVMIVLILLLLRAYNEVILCDKRKETLLDKKS